MNKVVAFFALLATAYGHELQLVNYCNYTVWVGISSSPQKELPANGGFELNSLQIRSLFVSNGWGGRLWGRTNCNAEGVCETGDCSGRIECRGNGPTPPVSQVEITLDGFGNTDFYDVSLVDGYNVPISMSPIAITVLPGNGDPNNCGRAGCNSDLNAICPEELAVKGANGSTIACKSPCVGGPCDSTQLPVDYSAIFKQACPDAYAFSSDDVTGTFYCTGVATGSSGYEIRFCS